MENKPEPAQPGSQPQNVPYQVMSGQADHPAPAVQPYAQQAVMPESSTSTTVLSAILLVLLGLTFFTPLGASLFLPLLIVGGLYAYDYIHKSHRSEADKQQLKRNPLVKTLKVVLILGITFVCIILSLIALIFLGFATGVLKLDMGS